MKRRSMYVYALTSISVTYIALLYVVLEEWRFVKYMRLRAGEAAQILQILPDF